MLDQYQHPVKVRVLFKVDRVDDLVVKHPINFDPVPIVTGSRHVTLFTYLSKEQYDDTVERRYAPREAITGILLEISLFLKQAYEPASLLDIEDRIELLDYEVEPHPLFTLPKTR